MLENNFEKNVKQKLDELSLSPSEPVWQKVEAAIQKKRRRRMAILWLPLFFAAGGALWWLLTLQHPVKQLHTDGQAPVESNTTFSKPHTLPPANAPAETIDGDVQVTNQKKSNTVPAKPVVTKSDPHTTTLTVYASKQKKVQAQNGWKKAVAETNKTPEMSKTATNTTEPELSASLDARNPEPAPATPDKTVDIDPAKDSAQNAVVPPADSVEKTIPPKIVKLQAKRKLQWQVVSRIGGSNTVAPVSFISGMKSFQQNRETNQGYNGGGFFPGSSGDFPGSLQPAAPVTGLHLSVGTTMKKRVGTRSFITAGLQYSYYSNRISVGERLPSNFMLDSFNNSPGRGYETDSGIGNLFTGTSRANRNNQFSNAYHFIELPIGFEYRLLKKLPLQLQQGVVLSQLVGSKALQYDGSTNVYYQSKSALRKTGIALFTSLSYTVWSGPSVSLQAGPHVQYGLQSFYKQGSNSHLLSGGVALSMGF